jgi:hypothetical protein
MLINFINLHFDYNFEFVTFIGTRVAGGRSASAQMCTRSYATTDRRGRFTEFESTAPYAYVRFVKHINI